MPLIFIFGNHPTLSLAELSHLDQLPLDKVKAITRAGICLDLPGIGDNLIDLLGGIKKIADVIGELKPETTTQDIALLVGEFLVRQAKSKTSFGISVYGECEFDIKSLSHEVKKILKINKQKNIRFVLPGESNELSAAQVRHDLTISKAGDEFLVLLTPQKTYIGHTLQIQNIDAYRKRDEERPFRLQDEGMMPIKLAQLLVNLAQRKKVKQNALLLDPFCGSGTILQEAMLKGYDVIGSDISKPTIDKCEQNLQWFDSYCRKNLSLAHIPDFQLLTYDAQKISQVMAKESVDAVVSEGYLGKLFTKHPLGEQRKKELQILGPLYRKSLAQVHKLLKPKSRVVFTLPYYLKSKISLLDSILDDILKIGYNQLVLIPSEFEPKISRSQHETSNKVTSYVYSRPDQIVGREVTILEKR